MATSLLHLTLHNFRSFEGTHTLTLPERGLVLLMGQSGHGKSNVLCALAYVLGCAPLPATALQCWGDEAPFWVEAAFMTAVGEITIRRGPKERWVRRADGSEVRGSADAVNKAVDEVFGIPGPIREFLTYRDQVEPMRLLTMEDKDLKSFLTKVLRAAGGDMDLAKIEAEIKTRTPALTAMKQDVAVKEQAIAGAIALLDQAKRAVLPHEIVDVEGPRQALRDAVEKQTALQEVVDAARGKLREQELQETRVASEVKAAHAPIIQAARDAEAALHAHTPVVEVDRTEETRIREQLTQCDKYLRELRSEDVERRRQFDIETEALNRKIRAHHVEQARVPTLIDRSKRLQDELQALEDNKCPTCTRQWANAVQESAVKRQELEKVQGELEVIRGAKTQGQLLEAEARARRFIPNEQVAQLEQIAGNLREHLASETQRVANLIALKNADFQRQLAVAKEATVRAVMDLSTALAGLEAARESVRTRAELGRLETQLVQAQGAVRVAEANLGAAERRLASNEADARQAAANVLAAEDKVVQAQAAKVEIEARLARESDYLDMIKGFYNKVFDEFFQETGAEATRMLAGLPNADRLSLEFRSEQETAAETVRSRFTPVVLVDGVPRTMREALSGGQTNSVLLAADLAGIRVIANRLGVALNWVVLDETFTGYGPQTKQACLELLQRYATDKLVLVVDHTSETQELFNKRVEVTMEYKKSSLRVLS